jgi:hypothetical protein
MNINTLTDQSLTYIYVSLFRGDPNIADNEVDYSGYERVAVLKSHIMWKTKSGRVSATKDIIFPKVSGKATMIEFWAISDSKTGPILYFTRLAVPTLASVGSFPSLTIGMRRSKASMRTRAAALLPNFLARDNSLS